MQEEIVELCPCCGPDLYSLFLLRFGQAITGALAVAYIGYSMGLVVLEYFFAITVIGKSLSSDTSTFVFKSVILIAFAAYAEAWSYGIYIENNPGKFTLGLFLLLVIRILLGSLSVNTKDRVLKEDDNSLKSLEENWNAGPKKSSIFSLYLSLIFLPSFYLFSA